MKKKDIIKDSNDFNSIIKKENKISNDSFAIYYRKNTIGKNRFGISVGKKLGNAVFRNKCKRRIRMIVTHSMAEMKNRGVDYVIILRKNGSNLNYQQLEKKYLDLLRKLKEI